MYIWLFSRSDGAGKATTRNTRGLTRSVIALIVPPFPAPSRPSNTRTTRNPLCFTQSWSLQSSIWSLRSLRSNSLRPIFALTLDVFCLFIARPSGARSSTTLDSRRPSPARDVRAVDAMLVGMGTARDLSVAELLLGVPADPLQFGNAVNGVHRQAEAIGFVIDR